MNGCVADRIRNEAHEQALDRYEADRGAFTAEELGAAASEIDIGVPAPHKRR